MSRKTRSKSKAPERVSLAGTKHASKKKRTPTPPVRGLALATLDAVRRELAFVYTQIKRREVQDDHGRTLVYALSTVAGVLKAEAELRIEERFGELEEKIVQLRGGRPE